MENIVNSLRNSKETSNCPLLCIFQFLSDFLSTIITSNASLLEHIFKSIIFCTLISIIKTLPLFKVNRKE